jgi:hypothetical protein
VNIHIYSDKYVNTCIHIRIHTHIHTFILNITLSLSNFKLLLQLVSCIHTHTCIYVFNNYFCTHKHHKHIYVCADKLTSIYTSILQELKLLV